MNPYLVIGAIVSALALYFYGHHKGWAERNQEMQVEIAHKNEEARQTEQKLTEQINQTSTKLQEANDVVTKKQTDLDRAIRAGRVRLPTSSCVQASSSTSTPTRNRVEERSEPDGQIDEVTSTERATLAAIAEIAAEGDRAINQLNACINAYNQVREQLNANR
jgi:Tfp pilus assembly protein PilE